MSVDTLITRLLEKRITLTVNGDNLDYRAPKGTMTAQIAQQIKEHKTELLALFKDHHNQSQKKTAVLTPVDRKRQIKASYAQQRLLFLCQLDDSKTCYNIPWHLYMSGMLDTPKLQCAATNVIFRHEALRTCFDSIESTAVLTVKTTCAVVIPIIDVTEDQVHYYQKNYALQQFDIDNGPLIKLAILRLSADEHILLINIHHLVADGWSVRVLHSELKMFYELDRQTTTVPLPGLTIQYTDYANWQKQQIESHALDYQLTYWQQQLKGAPSLLELSYDSSRPKHQRYVGHAHHFEFTPNQKRALEDFSNTNNVTLFMTLLAGFYSLLHRYSDQSDICIGTPVIGRPHSTLDNLIGLFVNSLPLRIQLHSNMTMQELIQRVKTTTLAAYANQDIPFEYLVEAINPPRSSSYSPLFQFMFSLQSDSQQQFMLTNVKVKPQLGRIPNAKYDMSLMLTQSATGLKGALEYNTDLFGHNTIEQFCEHYRKLLCVAIRQPARILAAIPLPSTAHYLRLLQESNDTIINYPKNLCVHSIFEAQLGRCPHAIALEYKEHAVSFSALNINSNRLARYLLQNAVKTGSNVAILMDKSPDMIAAIIAVLKVGACYVPIDPQHPRQHIDYLIKDSNINTAVTQSSLSSLLSDFQQLRCLLIDKDKPMIDRYCTGNLNIDISSNSPAYIIYTSGSTGRPKGVVVPHYAINRLVINNSYCCLGPNKKVLQLSSISFDAATLEIWGALLNASQCVLFADRHLSLSALENTVIDSRVDIALLTAPIFNVVVDEKPSIIARLSYVLTGADVICVEHIKRAQKHAQQTQIVHLYGPTESTTVATFYPIPRHSFSDAHTIAIGKPIANTHVYILDQYLNESAVGVPGELYIAGDGLALGYISQPTLTASSFVPDPFTLLPGQRMYKTGDWAKRLSCGNIEYLKRKDGQVKIRGVRIELPAIEYAMLQLPGIRQVVVDTFSRCNDRHQQELVAYLIAAPDSHWDQESLRISLQAELPRYMVPTQYIFLRRLPLTSNGKIDKKALPPVHSHQIEPSYSTSAPSTKLEASLRQIWAECLAVPAASISIHDNFFDLGGHSLLASKVVSRVQHLLGLSLTVKALFDWPSIYALANYLLDQYDFVEPATVATHCPVQYTSRQHPIPLSFAQQRLWFINQYEQGMDISYNIAQALRLVGNLNVEALRYSIDTLIDRHEMLRTTFAWHNNAPVQIIQPNSKISLNIVEAELPHLRLLIEQHTCQVFNLSEGPLLSVLLLRTSVDTHYMLVNMHHIIADGWSFGIFNCELASLYKAYQQQKKNPLATLEIQYADFAVWQRQWLSAEKIENQLSYWQKQLTELPAFLAIPTDKPRPNVLTSQGGHIARISSNRLYQRIQTFCQQQKVTVFMLTLSVFHLLLSRYSGKEDIFVGCALANRSHPNTETLVGFFVNMLVLRSSVNQNQSFIDYLKHIKTITLEAYENQDIPFDYLVERLGIDRSTAHHPLFNIGFTVQNMPFAQLQLQDLSVEPVHQDFNTAKFDLVLQIDEVDHEQQSLRYTLEYNTLLFERSSANQLLMDYEQLLTQAISSPLDLLHQFTLSNRQYEPLCCDQHTADSIDDCKLLAHTLFEKHAEHQPHATAVIYDAHAISYKHLSLRSNQIAQHLVSLDTSGSPIAIYCERCVDMLVAMLGVLTAEHAFVLIDPNCSAARTQSVLEACKPCVVLTQQRYRIDDGINSSQHRTLIIDEISKPGLSTQQCSQHVGMSAIQPHHLACIIYTPSKSKILNFAGIRHSSLATLIKYQQRCFSIGSDSNVLQSYPLTNNTAIVQILVTLASGATLHIPTIQQQHSQSHLAVLVRYHHISHAFSATVYANRLLEEHMPSLQVLVTTGERLLIKDRHRGQDELTIMHVYAHPQCTLCAAVSSYHHKPLTVGRAIDHIKLYVMDSHANTCATGLPGELYIGGAGIFDRYLNNPQLADQRLISNPMDDGCNDKLFQTGDIVRRLKNGELEYIGEVDQQLTVRGYRIECKIIEQQLVEHECVSTAVVIIREDSSGQRQLLAYINYSDNCQTLDTSHNSQIHEWRSLYNDSVYTRQNKHQARTDPTEGQFAGWLNSYDAAAIPREHMCQWADQTASRIKGLSPNSVLEIGCGTGILLHRLIPDLQYYVGSDFSENALTTLIHSLENRHQSGIELHCCEAIDFSPYQQQSFDTIVINSVIQYFPSAEYLLEVIEQSIKHLKPSGSLFIGDVRHLGLSKTFAASIALFQAAEQSNTTTLVRSIQTLLNREEELLVSPEFFLALTSNIPAISYVEILPKYDCYMNGYDNELLTYRYDVIVHTASTDNLRLPINDLHSLDWKTDIVRPATLQTVLTGQSINHLKIERIPNARLQQAQLCLKLLSEGIASTVGELRKVIAAQQQCLTSMEALIELGESLGYRVKPCWKHSWPEGEFDLLFSHDNTHPFDLQAPSPPPTKTAKECCNRPLLNRHNTALCTSLREWLISYLPEHMLPDYFISINQWPMTLDDKIDKAVLPDPDEFAIQTAQHCPPTTATQRVLVEIWMQVLNIKSVGIYDNFFEVGGHSLLATRIVNRIKQRLDITVFIKDLFIHKTISALSEFIDQLILDKQPVDNLHNKAKGLSNRNRDSFTL